jgi:D-sedoheptulose 7-phosphate isomerase
VTPAIQAIRAQMAESIAVKQALLEDAQLLAQIEALAGQCLAALKAGGKIIFAGNGGSFADAQHLSAEFISRFRFDRAPLASVALGTNNSAISAISNDYGYAQVFSRELEAVAKPGDVFIAISTSGNSPNILAAIEKAERLGIATACLTGRTGGKLAAICNCLRIPSDEVARVQECHITIGHIICGLVEHLYFAEGENRP